MFVSLSRIVAAVRAFLLVACCSCNSQTTTPVSNVPTASVVGKEFVVGLDSLGYFRLADKHHVNSLRASMAREFDPGAPLSTIWDDSTLQPLDYRLYHCDGEDVFESGGIPDLLLELEPTFKRIGFRCSVESYVEKWDDKYHWLDKSITINGTHHQIFQQFTGIGWGEAPKRIAEILNLELKQQGIAEPYI